MKILVTLPQGCVFDTFFSPEHIERLEKLGAVEWNRSERQYTKEELKERLKDTDICITGWGCPQIDSDMTEGSALRLIAHDAGSVGDLVTPEVYDAGVRVCTGNRMFAESVAEAVIAYALAVTRKIPQYNAGMHGELVWKETNFQNAGLFEKKIGVIGFGMVAQELLKMLSPFRCEILVDADFITQEQLAAYGANIRKAAREELFHTCDIVSVHATLLPENYHMVNEALLRSMKEGALLINTARGALVDEAALAKVLEEGRICAALDVYEQEPLPLDSPLRRLSNVLLMPHMAGPTIDHRMVVTRYVLDDVERFIKGEKLPGEIDKKYAGFMTSSSKMSKGAKT